MSTKPYLELREWARVSRGAMGGTEGAQPWDWVSGVRHDLMQLQPWLRRYRPPSQRIPHLGLCLLTQFDCLILPG